MASPEPSNPYPELGKTWGNWSGCAAAAAGVGMVVIRVRTCSNVLNLGETHRHFWKLQFLNVNIFPFTV